MISELDPSDTSKPRVSGLNAMFLFEYYRALELASEFIQYLLDFKSMVNVG